MTDIIHLLPDSVANQIAAGEVIQRPASCLKELVENSLDAGATRIDVVLYDAGRTMMQVVDNGKGMSETDARMAFERHATSKIQQASDLFELHTLGFRGEALASICAVAQVDVQTRRPEDEIGTRLVISGSEVELQEPCSCDVGTNFKVKNLFYNVPARRRFLKTDATELRNVLTEFYRIVLVNPQCSFLLTNNDEILLELQAGNAKQRIEQVFGKSMNKQFTSGLVEVKSDTELISIRGFVGKPEQASKTAPEYFFVNNRYMRHPYFHKAVLTAYQGMLTQDHNPAYFLYFEVNPEAIDVNIHPTKTEIKFQDEQAIWQILQATVREALGKFNVTPTLDFDSGPMPDIPAATLERTEVHRPEIQFDRSYNPFEAPKARTTYSGLSRQDGQSMCFTKQDVTGWQQLYEPMAEGECEDEPVLFDEPVENLLPYGLAGKYILLPAHDGLLVIDQHRAHVCVLYEELKTMLTARRGMSQQLLFPEVIDVNADEMSLLEQAEEELRYIGFDVSRFSPTAYSLNGLPAVLGEQNGAAALQHILVALREQGGSALTHWRDTIIRSLAEDAAMPYGRVLTEKEMRSLVSRLFALDSHAKTPSGKNVMRVVQVSV